MPMLTEDTVFKSIAVRFYMHPQGKLNKKASQEKGYQVYDDLEKVEIRQAGDNKQISHFNALDESDWREEGTNRPLTYAEVYSKQYAQFKANQVQIGDGTRIEVMPDITPAKLNQLKATGVYTIEALAAMDGANLKTLGMFGREMKDRAVKFLERTSKLSDGIAASKEVANLQQQLEDMKKEMAAMKAGTPDENPKAEPVSVAEPTPFDEWTIETIRTYLEDNEQELPSIRTSKADLIKLAMKVAKENQKANEAA